MEEECKHNFIKAAEIWEHHGLWKHLVLTIFCEKCGKIIQSVSLNQPPQPEKASARIAEIYKELYNKEFPEQVWEETRAIIQYLDEIQPCTHKSSYRVEGIGDVYYNVCDDCGVLFLAKHKDL